MITEKMAAATVLMVVVYMAVRYVIASMIHIFDKEVVGWPDSEPKFIK